MKGDMASTVLAGTLTLEDLSYPVICSTATIL